MDTYTHRHTARAHIRTLSLKLAKLHMAHTVGHLIIESVAARTEERMSSLARLGFTPCDPEVWVKQCRERSGHHACKFQMPRFFFYSVETNSLKHSYEDNRERKQHEDEASYPQLLSWLSSYTCNNNLNDKDGNGLGREFPRKSLEKDQRHEDGEAEGVLRSKVEPSVST